MAAAKKSEGNGHSAIELVPASGKALDLVFAQSLVVRGCAISFHAQGYARAEVVEKGEAPGINMPPGRLNTENPGAGVTSE